MVYRRCKTLLGNPADAEEATQEVFVRACRKDGARSGPASSWLYQIATNYCLNQLRNRKRRRELWDEQGPGAEAGISRQQQLILMRQLLSAADDQCATAAVFVYVDGMSHAEAASLMDVSRRTVGNLLERFDSDARRMLGEPQHA